MKKKNRERERENFSTANQLEIARTMIKQKKWERKSEIFEKTDRRSWREK